MAATLNCDMILSIIVVAVIIIILIVLADKDPPPRTTLTADTDNRASMSIDARPGNTVQQDHDQNIHSQIPTVCVTDSIMVIGRNDDTFWCPPTKKEEVGGLVPIKAGNDFNSFIHDYVIPTFCFQRVRGQQFAVMFLSNYDKHNIHKTQFGECSYNILLLQLLTNIHLYRSSL